MTPEFHEVGCRNCGEGGNWRIFTDGKGNFNATHSCGHTSNFKVVTKPDPETIDMRMFT